MIPVRLNEQCRELMVYVGEKFVGKIRVYSGTGRCAAYAQVEGKEKFLESFHSLSAASNAILEDLGYGRMKGAPIVERAKGGIIR